MSETLHARILQLYDEKKSTYEIAEILNTYPNMIRRVLVRAGKPLRTKSAAQKIALESGRKNHPTEGQERSYSDRLKIGRSRARKWAQMSDEDRDAYAEAARERWNALPKSKRDEIHDLAIQAIKKASVEGSKLEKFLFEKLSPIFAIEVHKKNLIPNENLEIDMYFPGFQTIIEIDGPSHFLPVWGEDKLRRQMKADLDKNGLILSKGFVIIRLKVLRALSMSAMEDVAKHVKTLLEGVQKKFPSQHKRYIEVDL